MLQGQLYKSGSASASSVTLHLEGNELVICAAENDSITRYVQTQLKAKSRIGNLPREVLMPDGDFLVFQSTPDVDSWLDGNGEGRVSNMESSRHWIYLSLLLVPLSLYVIFGFVLPWMAVAMADYVPDSVKRVASRQTLNAMDRTILDASELAPEDKQRILQSFEALVSQIDTEHRQFHIYFRQSDVMGANAFALPDGSIIFTDDMIELVDKQQPILDAILLHEIGHVEHNHSMQMIAESLVATLTISYVFGDLSGAVESFMGIGSAVVQNQFSQEHEWDADNFALKQLKQLSRNPDDFAAAMQKLAELQPENSEAAAWFSSHPMLKARIDNAQSYNGK
ncbi:M48 family metallopeptidase [Neptunicella sp. SCSIO 80796]|uniref:M48 family metallopeptidase n=1 Tax=Neptunicella plasticusilytica TaxID=3117012 RepID=UPI003A4DE42D